MLIRQLVIESASVPELEKFYRQVLELPVKMIDNGALVVSIGRSELVCRTARRGTPFYHFAINIPANKILEAKSWLKRKLELIHMEEYDSDVADFVSWHAKSVYFYDPAGNIVELIARFDLDNAITEPFSTAQLLSISEVGLVFPVQELNDRTEEILQRYNLSYFEKQAPLPQFKAVGDDEGLFIIVPDNRNWYPTDKPSGIFPMEIHFNNGKGQKCSLDIS